MLCTSTKPKQEFISPKGGAHLKRVATIFALSPLCLVIPVNDPGRKRGDTYVVDPRQPARNAELQGRHLKVYRRHEPLLV